MTCTPSKPCPAFFTPYSPTLPSAAEYADLQARAEAGDVKAWQTICRSIRAWANFVPPECDSQATSRGRCCGACSRWRPEKADPFMGSCRFAQWTPGFDLCRHFRQAAPSTVSRRALALCRAVAEETEPAAAASEAEPVGNGGAQR